MSDDVAVLRATLSKLRDLSLQEREEHRQVVETLVSELRECESRESRMSEEVRELREQLEAVHEAQKSAEALAEGRVDLEERNSELQAMVRELEEYKALSEAMEAEQADEMRRTRQAACEREDEAIELARTLEACRDALQQRDLAIAQLRQAALLAATPRGSDVGGAAVARDDGEEVGSLKERAREATLSLISAEARVASLVVESNLALLVAGQAQERLLLMRQCMPHELSRCEELEALDAKLTVERVGTKAALARTVLGSQSTGLAVEEALHRWEVSLALASLEKTCQQFQQIASSETLLSDQIESMRELLPDEIAIEKQIDNLVALAKRGQLARDYPASSISDLNGRMESILLRLPLDYSKSIRDPADGSAAVLSVASLLANMQLAFLSRKVVVDLMRGEAPHFPLEALEPCIECCAKVASHPSSSASPLTDSEKEALEKIMDACKLTYDFHMELVSRARAKNSAEEEGKTPPPPIEGLIAKAPPSSWVDMAKHLLEGISQRWLESAADRLQRSFTQSSLGAGGGSQQKTLAPAWAKRAERIREKLCESQEIRSQLADAKKELDQKMVEVATLSHKLGEGRRLSESLQEKLAAMQKATDASAADVRKMIDTEKAQSEDTVSELRKENAHLTSVVKELRTTLHQYNQQQTQQQAKPSSSAAPPGSVVPSVPALALGVLALMTPSNVGVSPSPRPQASSDGNSADEAARLMSALKVSNSEVRRLNGALRMSQEEATALRSRILELNLSWLRFQTSSLPTAAVPRRLDSGTTFRDRQLDKALDTASTLSRASSLRLRLLASRLQAKS